MVVNHPGFEPRPAHPDRGGGDYSGLRLPPFSAEHIRQIHHVFANFAGFCGSAGRGVSCTASYIVDSSSRLPCVGTVRLHRRTLLVYRSAPAQCARAARGDKLKSREQRKDLLERCVLRKPPGLPAIVLVRTTYCPGMVSFKCRNMKTKLPITTIPADQASP